MEIPSSAGSSCPTEIILDLKMGVGLKWPIWKIKRARKAIPNKINPAKNDLLHSNETLRTITIMLFNMGLTLKKWFDSITPMGDCFNTKTTTASTLNSSFSPSRPFRRCAMGICLRRMGVNRFLSFVFLIKPHFFTP